jgi:hypothetical protein
VDIRTTLEVMAIGEKLKRKQKEEERKREEAAFEQSNREFRQRQQEEEEAEAKRRSEWPEWKKHMAKYDVVYICIFVMLGFLMLAIVSGLVS